MNLSNLPAELLPFKEKIELTKKPFINIEHKRPAAPLSLTKSKFGGKPFWPVVKDYPTDSTGKELSFLAQINFAEIADLASQLLDDSQIMPKNGLLQFFVLDDDVYGLNFKDLTKQNTFRVVYHSSEDLKKPLNTILQVPTYSSDFVLKQEFELSFCLDFQYISSCDFRFNKANDMPVPIYKVPNNANGWYFDNVDKIGHRIGGYPYFTQKDPRVIEKYKDFTFLLLQIDSFKNTDTKKWDILWGDVGVGNFFINPLSLKNLDFSKVMYTWDCS